MTTRHREPWTEAEDTYLRCKVSEDSYADIARSLWRTTVSVQARVKILFRKSAECESERTMPMWVPTPEEIAAKCAEIQAGWTDTQRESRACGSMPIAAEIPQVTLPHLPPPSVNPNY